MAYEVWDRQPNETSRAYALFANYRDAGPFERGYPKVAREFGLKHDTIKQIAKRHNWAMRAQEWDAENERIVRAEMLKDAKAMARRQVLTGQLFQSKATKRIQGMTDEEVMMMSVYETARLYEVGERIERLGRGEPADLQVPYLQQNNVFFGGTDDTPILEILRRYPGRVGPVVENLTNLQKLLPELTETEPVSDTTDADELSAFFEPEEEPVNGSS